MLDDIVRHKFVYCLLVCRFDKRKLRKFSACEKVLNAPCGSMLMNDCLEDTYFVPVRGGKQAYDQWKIDLTNCQWKQILYWSYNLKANSITTNRLCFACGCLPPPKKITFNGIFLCKKASVIEISLILHRDITLDIFWHLQFGLAVLSACKNAPWR